MSDRLSESLQSLVSEYGYRKVSRSLDEIQSSKRTGSGRSTARGSSERPAASASKRPRARLTASQHVDKLELPTGKSAPIVELARRFDEKAFLPSFGDIAHFCASYGINEPSSRSRASAIPRVFRTLAEMEIEEIQRIMDNGLFSGPARLGPIADAIRGRSRMRAGRHHHTNLD